MESRVRRLAWLLVAVGSILTFSIYWAGLRGGFVYDDFSFILGNTAIQVTENTLQQWFAAAFSFPSGTNQGRWLGMLSFGINHFFTGMDPFWFKLTNLCIHLVNGLLVFLALRALFTFQRTSRRTNPASTFNSALAAACIATVWLVLPINLTAVLYVSQRLESLSNTFVFLGLWLYLRARAAEMGGQRRTLALLFSLIACTGVGALIKESAILLPLYAALVEFVLTGWRTREGRWNRYLLFLYTFLLVVPLVVGLVWLTGWVDGTRSYGRAFDIPERLMTEARILFDYMRWILVPNLDALTLYHDDIPLSKSLLSPATTLLSLVGIAMLLSLAVWKRNSMPLFSIGILWYFGGHVLTATVIPLLLAFEHRNYFPSLGLLLACASLLAFEGLRLRERTCALIFLAALSFYAFTTALRAAEWSDPLRLTMSEAVKRPLSPGAQFARAEKLLHGMQRQDGQSMAEDAFLSLDFARKLPNAGILFEQLLIVSHARSHRDINPEWWTDLIHKLEMRPVSASDAKALHNLNVCFIDKLCTQSVDLLDRAYSAAMAHGLPRAQLLNVHAEFAWYVLGDKAMGERDIRAAALAAPKDIAARRNLVVVLLASHQLEEAEIELATLRRQNRFGFFDDVIQSLEKALQEKRALSEPDADPAPAASDEAHSPPAASEPTENKAPATGKSRVP